MYIEVIIQRITDIMKLDPFAFKKKSQSCSKTTSFFWNENHYSFIVLTQRYLNSSVSMEAGIEFDNH